MSTHVSLLAKQGIKHPWREREQLLLTQAKPYVTERPDVDPVKRPPYSAACGGSPFFSSLGVGIAALQAAKIASATL